MPNTTLPHIQPLNILMFEDMAPVQLKCDENSTCQIAEHLRGLLKTHGHADGGTLRLPSTVELADIYNRDVIDVLEALLLLSEEHFLYQMNGLDSEIILSDPLNRHTKGSRQRGWRRFATELFHPHRQKPVRSHA